MKRLVCVITALIILMQCMYVYANAEYDIKIGAGADEDHVIISGKSNQTVSITIVKTSTDFSSMSGSDIVCMDTVTPGLDGSIVFKWLPPEDGEYDIYISDKQKLYTVENYIYYKSGTQERLMNTLKTGDKQSLSELFAKRINMKAVEADLELYDDITNKQQLADAFIGVRSELNNTQKEQILDYVQFALLLTSAAQTKTAASLDSFVENLFEKDSSFNSEYYEECVGADVKPEIGKLLLGYLGKNIGEITLLLNDDMKLCAINSENTWSGLRKHFNELGCSEYDNIKNKDDIDYNFYSSYGNKNYTSITELLEDLCEVIERPAKNQSTSGGGGGGHNKISTTVVVSPEKETIPEEKQKVFKDVHESDWFFEAVNYLKWKGIVSGYLDCFNPNYNITRAETVKMISNAFLLDEYSSEISNEEFIDVTTNDWFYTDVMNALNAGIVYGNGDGKFCPNEYITREDVVVMIYRILKKSGYEFSTHTKTFADKETIADYAVEAIEVMAGNGFINGVNDNRFASKEFASRAQIATIIYNIVIERSTETK